VLSPLAFTVPCKVALVPVRAVAARVVTAGGEPGTTLNALLSPAWPLPSAARSFIWLAVWETVTFPVHTPFAKLPEIVGVMLTGVVGGGKGVVSPELIVPIPIVAKVQSEAELPSELPIRW
jgi:hypothetical protein